MLVVFALYLLTRLPRLQSVPVYIDEAIYIHWAREALHGNLWASLLWDGKPPLHSWAMVPFLSLSGNPLFGARLASVSFGFLSLVGVILIGQETGGIRLGMLAGFLYAACPYCLWHDRVAISEGLLLALSIFAVYFALRAARSGRHVYLLGSAAAAGLALLTKGTAMLLYPVIALGYLARPAGPEGYRLLGSLTLRGDRHGRELAGWAAAAAGCLLLAFGIQNLLRLSPSYAGRSRFIATRSKGLTQAVLTGPGEMLRFDLSIAGSLLRFLTPVLLLLGLLGLLVALKNRWRPGAFFAAWFLVQAAVISVVAKYPWPRFYLVLVPPLLLSAAYCSLELVARLSRPSTERRPARPRLAAAFALGALALSVLVPVGLQSRSMIAARGGDEPFLSGRTCGAGLAESVDYLEREARRGTVTVVVNDYFLRLAIEMYGGGDRRIKVVSLDTGFYEPMSSRFKRMVESAAGRGTTYVLANNVSEIPCGWRVKVLRVFRKDRGASKVRMVLALAPGGGPGGAEPQRRRGNRPPR